MPESAVKTLVNGDVRFSVHSGWDIPGPDPVRPRADTSRKAPSSVVLDRNGRDVPRLGSGFQARKNPINRNILGGTVSRTNRNCPWDKLGPVPGINRDLSMGQTSRCLFNSKVPVCPWDDCPARVVGNMFMCFAFIGYFLPPRFGRLTWGTRKNFSLKNLRLVFHSLSWGVLVLFLVVFALPQRSEATGLG